MAMLLTFWKDPKIKRTPDDFDEILTIRLKNKKEIPQLIATRPRQCTMISTAHTANHVGQKARSFMERWRIRTPCPLCGAIKEGKKRYRFRLPRMF